MIIARGVIGSFIRPFIVSPDCATYKVTRERTIYCIAQNLFTSRSILSHQPRLKVAEYLVCPSLIIVGGLANKYKLI